MKNSVLDVINNRSSIRGYQSTPLTEEQTEALIEAALASPTARNLQQQHFTFVTDQALIREMEVTIYDHFVAQQDENAVKLLDSRDKKICYDAPLFIAISALMENDFSGVDGGIAVQSLALAAKSMGLDSVILGFPGIAFAGDKGDYFRERLQFPAGYDFVIGIAIGSAAMDKEPHEKDRSKVTFI